MSANVKNSESPKNAFVQITLIGVEPLPSHLNVNFVCMYLCMSWTGSILASK